MGIIFINFVELEYTMLYAKFQGHMNLGSGEKLFKGFYYIWAWRPPWSCDQDFYNFMSLLLKEAPHKILF